jgi:hypothetical protein
MPGKPRLRAGWSWRWRGVAAWWLLDRPSLKRDGFRYNWLTGGWEPPVLGRAR